MAVDGDGSQDGHTSPLLHWGVWMYRPTASDATGAISVRFTGILADGQTPHYPE